MYVYAYVHVADISPHAVYYVQARERRESVLSRRKENIITSINAHLITYTTFIKAHLQGYPFAPLSATGRLDWGLLLRELTSPRCI